MAYSPFPSKNEDTASADGDSAVPILAIRKDTPANNSTTDGDYESLQMSGGRLWTSTTVDAALPAGTNNIGDVDIVTMPTVTVNAHAVTNAGVFATQVDGAALTSLQLIDDTVATLGTSTYTEAATKANVIGAVRRDANTTLVDTTNEVAPLQVNATGELKVAQIQPIPAGTNNIGDVDVLSLPAIPAGTNNIGDVDVLTLPVAFDAGATSATTQRTITATNSPDVTALQLLDDTVATLGTDTYTEAATKGITIGAVRRDANTTLVNTTNEVAPLQVNATGELKVAQIQAIPAGNNNIGDVDVATLPVAFNTGTRSATTQRVSVATDDVVQVVGTIAHDTADTGNPVKIGGKAVSTAPTAVTANDRVDAFFDLQGRQVVAQKSATGTQTSVASSATNVTLLASNANRLGAVLYNDSSAICYVRLAATATSSNFSYKIYPDAVLEIPFGYTGIIDGIWASATGNMRVTEMT